MVSEARQPRIQVTSNGAALTGVLSANISSNAFHGADRFSIQMGYAAGTAPNWMQQPVLVDIAVSLGGVQTSLITGRTDSMQLELSDGTGILQGRDLTALFVSAQTTETFENQTASGIATTLANRRGLIGNISQTTDLVGRYYQRGRTRTTLSQHSRATSEWDLLTWLADQEGFDVWISGTTLNFQPAAASPPIMVVTPFNCARMQVRRALDLAAGVTIAVKSWDSQNCLQVMGAATMGKAGASALQMTAVRPNLAAQDASQLAEHALAQLSTHEIELTFDMPGELAIWPRSSIAVSQTGTGFDGTYQVVEVERHISFRRGYSQSVVARGLPWTPS